MKFAERPKQCSKHKASSVLTGFLSLMTSQITPGEIRIAFAAAAWVRP